MSRASRLPKGQSGLSGGFALFCALRRSLIGLYALGGVLVVELLLAELLLR
jgi:hypothetical protein